MYEFRANSGRLYEYDKLAEMQPPTIHEIAAHLAKEQRFGGAAKDFYSVAQHAVGVSVLVEQDLGPFAALYALHHDDHEFLLKDIPTPLKRYLADHSTTDTIGKLEDEIDEVIYTQTLDLEWPIPDYIQEAIAIADQRMYLTEGIALLRNFDRSTVEHPPADFTITPQPWERAEQMFLQRHAKLKTLRGRRVA